MKYLLFILFTFTSLVFASQIYENSDSSGTTVYSDVPTSPNSKVITTSDTNVVPSSGASPANQALVPGRPRPGIDNLGPTAPEKIPYTAFSISAPTNGETITNQPIFYVTVSVTPNLQKGDSIQIFLDGQPLGQPQATTQFQFNAPERGTHVVTAKLLDNEGNTLMTSSGNTIYLHQTALGGSGTAR